MECLEMRGQPVQHSGKHTPVGASAKLGVQAMCFLKQ